MNLWIMFLRGLATLAVNPALGGGGASRERLAQYLNFGADLVERGEEAQESFRILAEEVDEMARTGRQPSATHFERLQARSEAAWEKIQAAKRRLEEQEKGDSEPPPPDTSEAPEGTQPPEPETGQPSSESTDSK